MKEQIGVVTAIVSSLAVVAAGSGLYLEHRLASERITLIEDMMRRVDFFNNNDKRIYMLASRLERMEKDVRALNSVIIQECRKRERREAE